MFPAGVTVTDVAGSEPTDVVDCVTIDFLKSCTLLNAAFFTAILYELRYSNISLYNGLISLSFARVSCALTVSQVTACAFVNEVY